MKTLRILITILLALIVIFPFLYMVMASLSPRADFTSPIRRLLPSRLELSNYVKAFKIRDAAWYVLNSVMTSLMSLLIRLIAIIPASYAFSHMEFPLKRALMIILLLTLFIPGDAILFQNYLTISRLRLLDTWLGISLPLSFSAGAMIIMTVAFSQTDRNIYDAARLDGTGAMRYMTHILIPLNKSVVLLVSLDVLVSVFNAYLWPLIVTNKPSARTLQVAITMLGFSETNDYGAEMATILLVSFFFIVILAIFRPQIQKALEDSLYG